MLYWLGRFLFSVVFRSLFRLKVDGAENVPSDGPVIFAANHNSYADPPLVACGVRRPVYFMAKKELFGIPVLGWLIKRTHAFPVDRAAADFSALNNAVNLLKAGNALLIFPEGTRHRKGKARKLKNGVAMLAVTTGARVVPVAILNSDRMSMLPRLTVKFAAPVSFSAGREYDSITEEVMFRIMSLAGDETAYKR